MLYYAQNGTIQIFQEDLTSPIATAFIILICFLLGVIYNFLVIAAVIGNKKLRTSSFYPIIVQVTLICFLDSIIIESFAFGFLFNRDKKWCPFSASVFHLFLLMHSLTVSLLCIERTLHLHKIVLLMKSCVFGFLGFWLFGFLFTVPALVMSEISFFAERLVEINSWSGDDWQKFTNIFKYLKIFV